MHDPNVGASPKPPLTAGGIFMFLIGGVFMLVPGGCSLLFGGAAIMEKLSGRRDSYGISDIFLVASALGLVVAVGGFFLARAGLRRRKAN
jgi:hypothetical protein